MPQFTSARPQAQGPRKPRNPLVAAAQLRHAGAHRCSPGGMRQRAKQEVTQTLKQLYAPLHCP
ncbi:hypothetical protein ACG0Z6_11035 [Roseateles sp. BYS180W]|uniref:Uncharacterized protein n=1 Tax=Roseateles rivi TaxID=3299028 RepID=A0ABW7FWT8_9BURK